MIDLIQYLSAFTEENQRICHVGVLYVLGAGEMSLLHKSGRESVHLLCFGQNLLFRQQQISVFENGVGRKWTMQSIMKDTCTQTLRVVIGAFDWLPAVIID